MLSQLVNLSNKHEEGNTSRISMDKKLCVGKETPNSALSESVGVQVDMFSKKQFADKSLQITIYPETKDVDIQCVNALKENKEIQCKPTTNTKWINEGDPWG